MALENNGGKKGHSFSATDTTENAGYFSDQSVKHKVPLVPKIFDEARSLGKKFQETMTPISQTTSATESKQFVNNLEHILEAEMEKDMAKNVHGNLSCMLPVLDESQKEEEIERKQVGVEQQQGAGADGSRSMQDRRSSGLFLRSRNSSSTRSVLESSEFLSQEMRQKQFMTPGDIRLSVLEWLYEEKDVENQELKLQNMTILTELVPPLISVILHGNSDFIRMKLWAYILQCSASSLHFAFLAICSLQANQSDGATNVTQEVHKDDANEIDEVVNKNLHSLRSDLNTLRNNLAPTDVSKNSNKVTPNDVLDSTINSIEGKVDAALSSLEKVKHKHVMRHIDNSSLQRNSRKNIEFLINEIRRHVNVGPAGPQRVKELNNKLSFIKTLTDLDEWLRQRIKRSKRLEILKEKLQILNQSFPNGSYFPVACNSAFENHEIISIVVEETIVFNTAQKCPFLIFAEVHDHYYINENVNSFKGLPGLLQGSEGSEGSPPSSGRKEKVNLGLGQDSPAISSKFVIEEGDDSQEEDVEPSQLTSGWTNMASPSRSGKPARASKKGNSSHRLSNSKRHQYAPANQRERWEDLVQRIQAQHESKQIEKQRPDINWRLAAMFVKSGDDLRQQQLGVLLLSTFQKIFLEEQVFVKLFPYKVIATGPSSGLLEPAKNTDSLARLKERLGFETADEYFFQEFEKETNEHKFRKAQDNFMRSLAGYSIVSYLIKLHDRHNGNILLDTEGHFMHIDYGFMLGHVHRLERSPFKLTTDLVNILDGPMSPLFQQFRRLMEQAFIAANKHYKEIVLLAQLMSVGSQSACFAGGRRWVIDELRGRFCPGFTKRKLKVQINNLIDQSMGNYTTHCYDKYQRFVNGIF